MRWLAPIAATVLFVAVAARGQAPEPCSTRLCRLEQYEAAFRQRSSAAFAGPSGSIRTRPDCAPLHWRRASLSGTQGNAFDETSHILCLGRDAALVADAARRLEATHTVDGTLANASAWQLPHTHPLALITLETVLSGMRGYATMHGTDVPPPETTARCTIVHVDSCTARIGYACSGFPFQKQLEGYPEPAGGHYVFETALRPQRATHGLFDGEVLPVRGR